VQSKQTTAPPTTALPHGLGLVTTTEPRYYGATCNPWHPELSPGGSSGGAAALVAAGISPVAHASDGGGSIRIPASCCGLVGLKPSRGRVSFGPAAGEAWAGMAFLNCVSLTVRDTAAFLDAVAGPEPGDPYTTAPPPRPFIDEVGAAPGPQRIGLCLSSFNGQPVDGECVAAARNAAAKLEDLGHHIVEIEPLIDPDEVREAIRLGHIDAMSDGGAAFRDAILPTIAFTSLFNATGQPAISLPMVTRDNGLPIGIQLVAPHGQEGLLLRIAAEAEAAYPWARRVPEVHVTKV
jgi:Asp-tRNA(Asn)/Glu-tRNA(Gln) amidotransferase A subunit family amidase